MSKKIVSFLLVGVMLAVSAVQADSIRLGSSYISLANIYQDDTGYSIWRYDPELEQGNYAMQVTYDEVESASEQAASSGEHVLLEEVGDISFWVLTSGECQVNSPTIDGTTYEFVFGC